MPTLNEDSNVWEAVAGVTADMKTSFAAHWLAAAVWAQRMWLLTHDLIYAARLADYMARANEWAGITVRRDGGTLATAV